MYVYIYIYICMYTYKHIYPKFIRGSECDSLYQIQAFQPSLEFHLKPLPQKLDLISKT